MTWHLKPTSPDRWIAAKVEEHASALFERPARLLTFAADEKLLMGIGCAAWVLSRRLSPEVRREADRMAISFGVTVVLPHLVKRVVDQERPDREVRGPRNGIPISGRKWDAFPSGHAMHVGAIASGLARYFPRYRVSIWGAATVVAATRVILLAHWLSDVAVGLGTGIAIEHIVHGIGSMDPNDHS